MEGALCSLGLFLEGYFLDSLAVLGRHPDVQEFCLSVTKRLNVFDLVPLLYTNLAVPSIAKPFRLRRQDSRSDTIGDICDLRSDVAPRIFGWYLVMNVM